MTRVSEVVTHILFHVNAEARDSDPSQAPGVAQRARLVRDAVATLRADSRDLSLRDLITAIRDRVPTSTRKASLRRALANVEQRPQLAIQAWVGKNRETR